MLSVKTSLSEPMNYNDFWDNVLKQEEWNDELKRWENTHPEYNSFKEDSDSQRQLMQFQVTITETNVSTVCFETEEEAREFMNEPDYDLCNWECIESKIILK